MATKITGAGTEALEARVAVPSLDGYLADDRSFVPAVARTLAAIARHDKVVSPAELDVLMDFARGSVSPGLVGTIIFTALQDGVSLDRAIKDLASCSENATPEQREAAINSAMPILTLQGARARELAMRLAEALDQPSFESEFPRAEEWGFFDDLVDGARRTIGRGDAADAVAECGRSMGSVVLIEFYRSYRKGKLTRRELVERVR
ncbi:MAG: hypothetical protein NT025_00085, partial [bacterium]|nr:hypothetical protein [bacterium]